MSYINIHSKYDEDLILKIDENYTIDMTTLKMRQLESKLVAEVMANQYIKKVNFNTRRLSYFCNFDFLSELGANKPPIDTIVCMEGCEFIGAYLADAFMKDGFPCNNAHKSFYVMNLSCYKESMIKDRNVVIVVDKIVDQTSLDSIMYRIKESGGNIMGISSIFSNIDEINGYSVNCLFNEEDLPKESKVVAYNFEI